MRRINLILTILALVIFFNACKTKHVISNFGVIIPLNERDLVDQITEFKPNIKDAFFKRTYVKIETGKESQSFKSNIFLKKDSFIRVSILAPMGIEVARVSLEPENVIIIDRINRVVIYTDYDEVYNRYGIKADFNFFQNIFLDEAFSFLDDKGVKLDNYHSEIEGQQYKLTSLKEKQYNRLVNRRDQEDIIFHCLWIDPQFFYMKKTSFLMKKDNLDVEVVYDDFNKNFSDFYFPNEMIINGQRDDQSFTVSVSYGSIQFNKNNNISFNIPDKYEKVYH